MGCIPTSMEGVTILLRMQAQRKAWARLRNARVGLKRIAAHAARKVGRNSGVIGKRAPSVSADNFLKNERLKRGTGFLHKIMQ